MDFQSAIKLIIGKVREWLETAIEMLPNLAVAIILVVAFYFLAKLGRYGTNKLDRRAEGRSAIIRLIGNIIFAIILGVGVFIALSILQLDKAVTSLLAGAGIIGLALGFAFQETASNFLAGVLMAMRKPFRIGDMIETADTLGIVKELNLRSTVVRTLRGQDVIIPNKTVYFNAITNYARYRKRRIDLAVGVSYGDDLEKVKNVSLEVLDDLLNRDKSKDIKIWYDSFGDSSINFTAAVWVETVTQAAYRDSVSEAIMKLKKAFDDNDISIPFPIRTLDFGIKGGEKLDEMKLKLESDQEDSNDTPEKQAS